MNISVIKGSKCLAFRMIVLIFNELHEFDRLQKVQQSDNYS